MEYAGCGEEKNYMHKEQNRTCHKGRTNKIFSTLKNELVNIQKCFEVEKKKSSRHCKVKDTIIRKELNGGPGD